MKKACFVFLIAFACIKSQAGIVDVPKIDCEQKVISYVNNLFITQKHIVDCSPPARDCFHRFELESTAINGDQTYFASYDRNEGYPTSEIFRVTVNSSCEVINVEDDSN